MIADTRILDPRTGEVIALETNGHRPQPYPFRTYRCTACGRTQPDAGQSACLVCGTFWSLEPVWPQEEDL